MYHAQQSAALFPCRWEEGGPRKTGDPNQGDSVPVEWKPSIDLFDYLDLGKVIHNPDEQEKAILRVIWEILKTRGNCTVREFQTAEIMPK